MKPVTMPYIPLDKETLNQRAKLFSLNILSLFLYHRMDPTYFKKTLNLSTEEYNALINGDPFLTLEQLVLIENELNIKFNITIID